MKQIFAFIRALLKRHWVSFLLASIVPAIVGLIAVAATTVITDLHYGEFLGGEKYDDLISIIGREYKIYEGDIIPENTIKWNKEGVTYRGGATYEYYLDSETEKVLEKCEREGTYDRLLLSRIGKRPEGVEVIDYKYWQNFPARIYRGSGFTGTRNEILLDISNIGNYEIGGEYEFSCSENMKEWDTVTATVVGFTRSTKYLDCSNSIGILCLPREEMDRVCDKKTQYNCIKIDRNLLRKLRYKYVSENIPWEEQADAFIDDLRAGNYYVPEEVMQRYYSYGHGSYDLTVGSNKRAFQLSEDDTNKFTIVLFLAAALSLLAIVSDLCINGSMLSSIERISVRCGLRHKDVAIGYVIKAVLQFLFSMVMMLGVILYYNHKTGALLIMEHIWAGAIVVLALGLVSWTIDCVRIYLSQRGSGK